MRISLSLASWDYRMIRAVDGLEIRGAQTVHAQGEGKLSSMVKIVLDDVPDDPLARECIFAPTEGLIQVGEVPARQAVLDHLPGGVESTGEFGGAARVSGGSTTSWARAGLTSPMTLWNHQTRAAIMWAAIMPIERRCGAELRVSWSAESGATALVRRS